jgi:hypothetical protein
LKRLTAAFGTAVLMLGCSLLGCALIAAGAAAGPAAQRIEARSANYLLVAVVTGETMQIHVSRVTDNAPVRDAQLAIVLRGASHAATAAVDGGYTLESKDLALPGAATIDFQVSVGSVGEGLHAVLQAPAKSAQDESAANWRNYGWWVLNFSVCIGFLLLISRRRKAAGD